jgi:uncharacterized protein
MWLLKLALLLAAAYVAIAALAYAMQTRMLFPTGLATAQGLVLPDAATRLEVETPDGERLGGIRIAPASGPAGVPLVVLGFGGNAWNADSVAVYLHSLYPHAEVIAFHYRGYAPSTGRPSAAALIDDAPLVYDHAVATVGSDRVVAVGFSIGASVAAELATQRELAGLILVSPFDSLESLAREHYPWLPVRWFLLHHFQTAEALAAVATPTAVIAAGRDTIVPPRRTEAVRRVVRTLVLDRTIVPADHNDIYHHPDFRAAMVDAMAVLERG